LQSNSFGREARRIWFILSEKEALSENFLRMASNKGSRGDGLRTKVFTRKEKQGKEKKAAKRSTNRYIAG